MTTFEERILNKVRDHLGDDRAENSIIYLDHNLKSPSQQLHVGDAVLNLPWNGHIAFVDLEPRFICRRYSRV